MELNSSLYNHTFLSKGFTGTWEDFVKNKFSVYPQDLPEVILVLALLCAIGAFLNLHLKDFLIPLPVILFLIGCCFEILSFTSDKVLQYTDAVQWMSPHLFFDLFTPIIIFNVAFDLDVYMFQKLFWQIILITVPGYFINYALILSYLVSVNKLNLRTSPWLLFSTILMSSDPMLTAAAIRDLGLSRGLINLINGESLMTAIMSFNVYASILKFNTDLKSMNHSLAYSIMEPILSYYLTSFLLGILCAKLIQLWMSTVFGDDVNHISLSVSVVYLIYFICELLEISGFLTLAFMGLLLNSTSFKPGVEVLLVELLVFLLLSPLLSRLGDGFSWRWAFIMVSSEMRGVPNVSMALLLAYSDLSVGTEREKSQVLFHAVSVCLITLVVNRVVLPMVVSKLGLHDITSTKYKSLYYTFQHFQETTKSTASALKFDKDLANADWNMVEKAIVFQNPYALSQGETTEHQKVVCPNCNKEIDETLNIEAMELANRRLLSAQIASYQRQYRNETLSQSAVQMLVGAAGSFGEKGEYMSPDTIKTYSESKTVLTFVRKVLLNWVYNTKKEKGVPSRYCFLRSFHKIVFTDEFEFVGFLVILMNIFPLVITWVPTLDDIYETELRHSNFFFLSFYFLECLFKIAAMRKEYFLHTWNLFELGITLIGIIDVIIVESRTIVNSFNLIQLVVFFKTVRIIRILRILKLVTPKLLQLIDKRLSHQLSYKYAILKGFVQGESDIRTIIDQIASSKQIKQVLLKRVMRNTAHAMRELGYLEYDHPEIAVTMKTKEEINVMLNLAREIIKVFRLKGILHKIEASEINKLIMDKKRELLDFQPIIKPLTLAEALYHIPWLDKDKDQISFIQDRAKLKTFDCGNDIFEEGDEPKGIYIIISGMIKLQRSKPGLIIDQTLPQSEEKDLQITYSDYVISGEIIGELNCLTNEPMKYSAICKTVVETCFIPKNHLYRTFKQCCPQMEYKMWLKLGLSITAKKIRERLSYEDWNYKMQLKLCNVCVKDIPKGTKCDIYDETVIYVILINGVVEDCQLRKVYKAPSLIPLTCHQIQGTEDFTKVVIVQTSINMKKFRWTGTKYVPAFKASGPTAKESELDFFEPLKTYFPLIK
ncbi:PREDICTED: sodium/hydrogen exchanger 10 [Miniopterus natalensis]|uniref:sodium/hydrogen exchanger 10 n=1 Tax=Miniopterus natalensis TaxID=291302 RepID=UPI0007A6F890|nr:PREDICTED: sodium/hydrogen exchanger 10 [Miniopterus natalensis]